MIVALSRVNHRDGYYPRTLERRNGRILKHFHVYPCVSDGTHSRIKNGSSSLYNDYRVFILQVFLRKNIILTKCAQLAGKWIALSFSLVSRWTRVPPFLASYLPFPNSFPEFRWRLFLADGRPDRVHHPRLSPRYVSSLHVEIRSDGGRLEGGRFIDFWTSLDPTKDGLSSRREIYRNR